MMRVIRTLPYGFVLCWAVALSGQDSTESKKPCVEVPGCRVVLIDRVTLASGRTGVLADVGVRESDRVQAKQTVVSLDSTVAEAALAVARQKASSTVERRMALKLIELTQAEYDKAVQANQKVQGGGVFGDIDMRRMKLNVEKSGLQFEQAENEILMSALTVKQLEAEMKTYTVQSPFDGIVTRVYRSKGEAVNVGDPLVEVVNLEKVRVEGFVGIVDGLRVNEGAQVVVKLDLPDVDVPQERLEFQGKLIFVDVGVEPVSGQIRVWAEVANPKGILRSGLPARMKILTSNVNDELTSSDLKGRSVTAKGGR